MLFIYYKPVNFLLRNVLKPFSSLIPEKFHFPVYGSYHVKIEPQTNITVITNPTSHLGKLLFWGGVKGFEYDCVRIFIELAKKSNLFFDIGANTGYYSLVASAVNKKINVCGFEPMPDANYFYHLNRDANNFSDIKIEEFAMSDRIANLEFAAVINPKFKSIQHQLAGDGRLGGVDKKTDRVKMIKVKSITLDEYVAKNDIKKIDLIKIDTEGSENLVFSGGRNVLKYHRPIIQCEVLHNRIESELEAIFNEYDYAYFIITPKGLLRKQNLKSENEDKADYYFVPLEKTDLVKKFIL